MITRILIPIILGTVLPYLWIDLHYCRFHLWWRRLLFWLPALGVIGYTSYLAWLPNFIPDNPLLIDIWFVALAFFAVPPFVFSFCSLVGWSCMCLFRGHHNWGKLLGLFLSIVSFFCFFYGFTRGFRQLEVKHLTVYVPDLPKSFDGYRIVQFSDIHLGSYYGWRGDLPQRDIDTILSLHPDMICFTGDLQNVQPSELQPYKKLLSRLEAKDGVYSVLGNHDYSYYVDADTLTKQAYEREVKSFEREVGWHLLNNKHAVVCRGKDSIFVAGTENYEKPDHANIAKALYGIRQGSFVLMLQHIPKQWRETWPSNINKIHGSKDTVLVAPRLTLSGHTHAGQVSFLGIRPTMFTPFDYGLYEKEGCQLYTTAGLGGTVPIRLGATPEIVVITLRCK